MCAHRGPRELRRTVPLSSRVGQRKDHRVTRSEISPHGNDEYLCWCSAQQVQRRLCELSE